MSERWAVRGLVALAAALSAAAVCAVALIGLAFASSVGAPSSSSVATGCCAFPQVSLLAYYADSSAPASGPASPPASASPTPSPSDSLSSVVPVQVYDGGQFEQEVVFGLGCLVFFAAASFVMRWKK